MANCPPPYERNVPSDKRPLLRSFSLSVNSGLRAEQGGTRHLEQDKRLETQLVEKQEREAVIDRGLGCLVGLAIGDALGTTVEFSHRDARPPVTDLVGGGPFGLKAGEWTDDTSMALCLADSLLACSRLDTRDLMQRFLRWRDTGENSVNGRVFDFGTTVGAALERYRRSGDPQSGSTDPFAAGNGSIMRLAPVALRWHHDRNAAVENAREQTKTTHGALEAVEASALLAEILVDAIQTGDKAFVLRPRETGVPNLAPIAQGQWKEKARDDIRSSAYVVHTLEAALWSVHCENNFRDAILLAANLGGDADTIAAVAGQIAGALWGLSAIPAEWLQKLAWRDEIEDRASKLLAAASR